ncbi:MAG: SOS response-associated peptidase [Pseudomonadota bacterium]
MCGRYFLTSPLAEIMALFGVDQRLNLAARYNIAPTQDIPIVISDPNGTVRLTSARWGLVPPWADGPAATPLHNARGESVAAKPAFREAFSYRRCLIPANGFFDWQGAGAAKQPYRFSLVDGGLFSFGGIYSPWRRHDGTVVQTCAIVTTEANDTVRPICHRMPVMVGTEDHTGWLGSNRTAGQVIRPFPLASMTAVPVSRRVGDVRQDDSDLIEPVNPKEEESQLTLL